MKVLWNQIPEGTWCALTRETDHALQQDWHYGAALEALGGSVLRAEIRNGGQTVGLAQFTARRVFGHARAALCSRGPLWLEPLGVEERADALRMLKNTAPLAFPRAVLISPDEVEATAPMAAGLHCVATGYGTGTLDLTQPTDVLRAAMKQKWRNRLTASAASARGDLWRHASPELLSLLAERETAQRKAKGYDGVSPHLAAAFHAMGGRVAIAERPSQGGQSAAMVFLRHGRQATYQIGWATDNARKQGAHPALLWRAIQALAAEGQKTLDLGGISTEASPGLARFKLGSGARPLVLCGTFA